MSVLGEKLISHVLQFDSMSLAIAEGLKPELLIGNSAKAFADMLTATRPPSFLELNTRFGIEEREVEEPDLPFLVEQVRKRYVTRKCGPEIEKAIKAFEGADPMLGLDIMANAIQHRADLFTEGDGVHRFKADAMDRVDDYMGIAGAGGVLGIKSMWDSVNTATGGWANGWLYSIVGFTSIGKSWGLCIIADDMSKQLTKDDCILIVTTEMGPKRLARRVDCVKFNLPFGAMRDGELDAVDEAIWAKAVDEAQAGSAEYAELIFVSKTEVSTVRDIRMFEARYKPKAVLIDGGYRLKSSTPDMWANQVEVIRELQTATEESDIPWLVTGQLGDKSETGKSKGAGKQNVWNVRYAKEWTIDPDVVLMMSQTEDMFLMEEMGWEFGKVRDGDGPKISFRTRWDRTAGEFEEIAAVSATPFAIGAPTVTY